MHRIMRRLEELYIIALSMRRTTGWATYRRQVGTERCHHIYHLCMFDRPTSTLDLRLRNVKRSRSTIRTVRLSVSQPEKLNWNFSAQCVSMLSMSSSNQMCIHNNIRHGKCSLGRKITLRLILISRCSESWGNLAGTRTALSWPQDKKTV